MVDHSATPSARRTVSVCALLLAHTTALVLGTAAAAEEVTVQNDSLVDFGSALICPCFVTGEEAAAWLTSPCDGDIVALQIFWRSWAPPAPDSLEAAIRVYAEGSFPVPGATLLTLLGPVLTDNDSFDEFRFSDGAGTVPIQVPVSAGETFVLSLEFENTNSDSPFTDPSVVNDAAGCKPSRNAIYAQASPTFQWIDACSVPISGDWVLRAVVDCAADVGIFTDGFESGDVSAWTSSDP